jgi:site-specific DNA-methyltransferase (adenine-specific)
MNIAVHFSSETVEWETPQALFDELDTVFRFQLDVCAAADNRKVKSYFSKTDDGLAQQWTKCNWMIHPMDAKSIIGYEKCALAAMLGASS